MLSASLRLRRLLNQGDGSLLQRPVEVLDQLTPPTLLITEPALAAEVLRHRAVESYHLLAHWKAVTRLDSLPTVDALYRHTPLFLEGAEQRASRREVMLVYKAVEADMQTWLPSWSRQTLVSVFQAAERPDVGDVCHRFVSEALLLAVGRYVGRPDALLSWYSQWGRAPLFQMFPQARRLQAIECELAQAHQQLQTCLQSTGFAADLWPLMSLLAMGREPLHPTLMAGLMQMKPDEKVWPAGEWLRRVAPVGLIGRRMTEDVDLSGVVLRSGQGVFVAPALLHPIADAASVERVPNLRSFEFGQGVHMCAGRGISLLLVQAFGDAWSQLGRPPMATAGWRLVRDIVLSPVHVPDSCTHETH